MGGNKQQQKNFNVKFTLISSERINVYQFNILFKTGSKYRIIEDIKVAYIKKIISCKICKP